MLIEFHIAKDGRLEYIELRRSSGTQILDEAALTAVKLAQPFPQVPESLCKETLAIDGQFRYQIKSGRPFGQISERATSSLLSMGLVGPRR